MTKDKNKTRLLSDLSLKDSIIRCGELQMTYADTCRLLASKKDPAILMEALMDHNSQPYNWYQEGVSEGKLHLNINLEDNVGNPKAKDAYKHLMAERNRQAINDKLDELF